METCEAGRQLAVTEFVLERVRTGSTGQASAYGVAVSTAGLVRRLVEGEDWVTAEQLIQQLRQAAQQLQQQLPNLTTAHNVIKRILKLVREEYVSASKSVETEYQPESLQKMLKSEAGVSDWGKKVTDFKERVFEILEELLIEIETCSEEISKQSIEHIHANEIILTIGHSRTVERFLKHAARTRRFEVMVAEAAPGRAGQAMATSLARSKISTTLITDSAIFAMMARVNKVIIGTSSILADGTVVGVAGARTVALAAHHHSVPCIVLAAAYKLTPTFQPEAAGLQACELASPCSVLRGGPEGELQCLNPLYDRIPPSLVTLYISNISGYSPSYVYRQMGDLYHHQDRTL